MTRTLVISLFAQPLYLRFVNSVSLKRSVQERHNAVMPALVLVGKTCYRENIYYRMENESQACNSNAMLCELLYNWFTCWQCAPAWVKSQVRYLIRLANQVHSKSDDQIFEPRSKAVKPTNKCQPLQMRRFYSLNPSRPLSLWFRYFQLPSQVLAVPPAATTDRLYDTRSSSS